MTAAELSSSFIHPPPLISLPPPPSSSYSASPQCTALALPSPFTKRYFEAAGRAYQLQLRASANKSTIKPSTSTSSLKPSSSSDFDRIDPSAPQYSYAALFKQQDLSDYYALLGLSDLTYSASTAEIRKAYKTVSVVIHPDKAPNESDREHCSELFKATQKAYETLIDPIKRRQYDSSLDFDDSIPDDDDVADALRQDPINGFYTLFHPIFQRNSLFSVSKPVPIIGAADSPYSAVNEFYDFWFSFKSWRDFSYLNEYQLEQASGRDEKRWMERENAKLQAGKKKEESARIRTLVDRAYKYDPRIKRQAAEIEAERRRKKLERKKQQQQNAVADLSTMDAATRAELDRQYREQQREKERQQQIEKTKDDVTALCKKLHFTTFTSHRIRDTLPHNELKELVTLLSVGTTLEEGKALYSEYVYQLDMTAEQRTARQHELEAAKRYEEAKRKEQIHLTATFSSEEDSALTKAILRFPGGIKQRWEKITDAVNQACMSVSGGGKRTMQEVIKRSKELEAVRASAMAGKTTGNGVVSSDEAFQKYMSKLHVDDTTQEVTKQKKKPATATPTTAATPSAAATAESKDNASDGLDAAERLKIRQLDKEVDRATKYGQTVSPSGSVKKEKKPAAAASTPSADDWSVDEQALLERALKEVPKDDADRWQSIANVVKTKTKKQCVARFKALRDMVKQKQQSK